MTCPSFLFSAPSDVAPPATDPTNPTNMDPFSHQAYDAVTNPFGGDFLTGVSPTGPGDTLIVAGAPAAEPGSPSGPGTPEPGSPGAPGGPDTAETGPGLSGGWKCHKPGRGLHLFLRLLTIPLSPVHRFMPSLFRALLDPSQVLRGNVHLTGGIVASVPRTRPLRRRPVAGIPTLK